VDDYPPVLNDLLEKKFAFQFKISKYNLDKNVEGYSISKLTDDTEIISELEKKLVEVTPFMITLESYIHYILYIFKERLSFDILLYTSNIGSRTRITKRHSGGLPIPGLNFFEGVI